MRRTRRPFFATLLPLLLLPAVARAFVPTFVWPGPAPCDTASLHDCMSALPDGAIVQIATNEPVLEVAIVERGQVLVAATGFSPTLSLLLLTGAGGEVRDMTIRQRVLVDAGHGMKRAWLRGNVILSDPASAYAIEVTGAGGRPRPGLDLRIEDNVIRGSWICVYLWGLGEIGRESPAVVARNQMRCANVAIAASSGGQPLQLTIDDNQIDAGFGIGLDNGSPGGGPHLAPLFANVHGNQVRGRYGAGLAAFGGGPIDLAVSENSFAGGHSGLYLYDPDSLWLSGGIWRNVIAFHQQQGITQLGGSALVLTDNVELGNAP